MLPTFEDWKIDFNLIIIIIKLREINMKWYCYFDYVLDKVACPHGP